MSQENVEVAQRSLEAYNRGDVDAAFSWAHPEIEWVVAREHPEARTLRGLEAIFIYRREWMGVLGNMRVAADRIVDAGDSVVVVGRVIGVGVGSGAEIEVPIAFVQTFRSGRVVRVEEYINPAEALESVGMEPTD